MFPVWVPEPPSLYLVSRTAVEEIFRSWNRSKHADSRDSLPQIVEIPYTPNQSQIPDYHPSIIPDSANNSIDPPNDLSEEVRVVEKKRLKKKPSKQRSMNGFAKKFGNRSLSSTTSSDSTSGHKTDDSSKLPMLMPKINSVNFNLQGDSYTRLPQAGPPTSPPNDRKRFVTVFRPQSVFTYPPPLLPGQYQQSDSPPNAYSFFSHPRSFEPPPGLRNKERLQAAHSTVYPGATNLAGSRDWDLSILRRNYGGRGPSRSPERSEGLNDSRNFSTGFPLSTDERPQGLPPWNPYFAYARLLSQNTPINDDWRRHVEVRRRALERRRSRRRTNQHQLSQGEQRNKGGRVTTDAQTDGDFMQLEHRSSEAQTGVQTEFSRLTAPSGKPFCEVAEIGVQVEEGELEPCEDKEKPVIDALIAFVMEISVLEVTEEEELAFIAQKKKQFEERKQAQLTELALLQAEDSHNNEDNETVPKEDT